MPAQIGIKLADGSFFPIMNEDFSMSEKLELTTVRDDQRSVQINLFKKADDFSDPEYIGSLIVEDIQQKAAGEPTIELSLSLDDEKNLSAEAVDTDSGSRQGLKVSLETLSDHLLDDIDFGIHSSSNENPFDSDFNDDIDSFDNDYAPVSFYSEDEKTKRRVPVWLLILLLLLGIAALVIGILLLTKGKGRTEPIQESIAGLFGKKQENEPEEETAEISQQPLQIPAAELPPMQKSEEKKSMPPPDEPASEPPEPQKNELSEDALASNMSGSRNSAGNGTKMHNAIRHKLKWGETLWDLSETYYRTPWLYTDIAKHNNLRNPDLIISGTYIEIPPR